MESKNIFFGTTVVLAFVLLAAAGLYLTNVPKADSETPIVSGNLQVTPSQDLGDTKVSTATVGVQSSSYLSGRILTVSGTGVVSVKPDRSKIQMAILAEAPTAEIASVKNAEIFSVLLKSLLDHGILRDNIETVQYSINPIYEYNVKVPYIISYRAYHTISVTVVPSQIEDLGKLTGKIIDMSVSAGVNQINSIQFTVSDERLGGIRDDTLKGAVFDAQKKAAVIVSALGVKILGVQQVSESSYFPTPVYSGDMSLVGAKASTELVPGDLKISGSVGITYEIGN
ncbi:MAG TPA: SIMPL domain-containing protein [Nitrososphaerales archaeon]